MDGPGRIANAVAATETLRSERLGSERTALSANSQFLGKMEGEQSECPESRAVLLDDWEWIRFPVRERFNNTCPDRLYALAPSGKTAIWEELRQFDRYVGRGDRGRPLGRGYADIPRNSRRE